MKTTNLLHWGLICCLLSVAVACASTSGEDGEDYFPFQQNGKIGFIDNTGKIVIPPQFDSTVTVDGKTFSEGLAAVQVGENWGYINKAGKFVIPAKFKQKYPPSLFEDGLAQVALKEDVFGFIDRSGEIVKPLSFITSHTEFSEGLARVLKGEKFGYVDKMGKFMIEARFAEAEDFREGLAVVKLDAGYESKFGYIDKTGKMVIEPQFSDAKSFSEGLAAIELEDKFGFIDKQGKVVISTQFENAFPFSDGLAKVVVGEKAGFIDTSGKMIISPQFRYMGYGNNASYRGFKEGLSVEEVDDKVGYIDKTGKMIIPAQYDYASPFHSGLAQVSIGYDAATQKVYYINKTGKIVWDRSLKQ